MKKIILLALLLISTLTIAQDFNITKSKIFKDSKKHSSLSFSLDDKEGGLITVRQYLGGFPFKRVKGYYIQHFDSNLSLKNEYTYEVKRNRLENAFVNKGKLYLIEFEYKRVGSKLIYRALSANINDLKFESKEILSISEKNTQRYFEVSVFPFFNNNRNGLVDKNHMGEVTVSKNNNFFAINFDFNIKKKETHKVFVFNKNLEMVYDKLIVKNIEDRLFEYNSIEVDDSNGDVYFVGKSFENNSRRKKKKGKANYHFELNKINKEGQKVVSFKTPEKFIGSLSIIKNKNKISCVGFYGDKNEDKYNGVCIFNLNTSTLEMETKKFNPFSETFLSDKYGDREDAKKRKKKKGIRDIKFKSIETLPNGDLAISAEEDYITTHTNFGPNGTMSTRSVQHYDDIIVFRMDSKGNLKWSRNINKAQTGYQNSSFTPISIGDKTHFFINCSDKLKKLRDDRIQFKQTSPKKSNLYVISINGNGKFDFKKLIDRKDSEVFYKVNSGIISSSKNEVILLGKRKKKSQIIKVKI